MPSNQRAISLTVRALLFDMDGVLVTSTAADERNWLRWARFHGIADTFSIHDTHGRRTADTIRHATPHLDLATELRRLEDFDAEDTTGTLLYPGVPQLLASLPPDRWSIVTSASERILRYRLGLFGIALPNHIVTADHVTRGKPDPEPYRLGAEQLGIPPAECLVLEDAPAGIRSAKTAGCQVLAVASSHPPAELQQADWILPALNQLAVTPGPDRTLLCRFTPL